MVDRQVLTAEKRTLLGRKVKALRRDGILPANVYGKTVDSQAVQVDTQQFNKIYEKTGSTQLVDLRVKGKQTAKPVLIHNVQLDPLTDLPLHAEFYQVDLKQKVTAQIPITLKGEAPAVEKGGVLVQILDEVEVEALPTDLPEKFEVDISGLKEIGDIVTVEDLSIDTAKVTLQLENPQAVVVQIEEPAPEEEAPTPVEGEEAEGEAGEETEKGEATEGKEDKSTEAEEKETPEKPTQPEK